MPIIAYLGKDITDYEKNADKHIDNLDFYCPKHGVKLTIHGTYSRNVKEHNIILSIYRLGCPDHRCTYTQAIIPDFLQPYKHYSAHEITSVLIEAESDIEPLAIDSKASITTIRRWISQYTDILEEKISNLKTIILRKCETVVNEISLPIGKPMETLHKLLSILPVIHYTNTLGGAFIYANTK